MTAKSWLKRLVDRVAPVNSAHKRRTHLLMDVLEDRSVPATLTWTGTVDTSWNNAGNWSGGGVPSAVNNVLVFDTSSGTTRFTSNNNIPGLTGMTVNIVDANPAVGADFTLTGVNVGITALTNNKTDADTAGLTKVSMALTGAGATITATAGELAILNTANVFDNASSLVVPTGGIANISVAPSGSMGNAQLNLTGGQLEVVQSNPTLQPGLLVGQTNVGNDRTATSVPNPALGIDFQQFPMMADISRNVPAADDFFQTSTRTWGDNVTYFYSGEIFFPDSGDGNGYIVFDSAVDDSAYLSIDGVNYISYNNNSNGISTDPNTLSNVVALPTGWHTIDLRFGNGGGGAGPNNNTANGSIGWVTGNGSTTNPTGKGFGYRVTDAAGNEISAAPRDAKLYRRLNAVPTALTTTAATVATGVVTVTTTIPHGLQVGESVTLAGFTPAGHNGTFVIESVTGNNTFTYTSTVSGLANATAFGTITRPDDKVRLRALAPAAAAAITNTVNVSNSSTIVVDPLITGTVNLGNLNLAAGSTLNTSSSGPIPIAFLNTTLAGDATISPAAGAIVTLRNAVGQSAPAGLIKGGAGTLNLNAANTYSGVTTVSAGTLVAAVNGSLGTSAGATDGTVVSAGGRLQLGASYTNPENLFLNGTGSTATNGALTTTGSASMTYTGPITLQSNAWITSTANNLTLSGGLTNGGFQPTFSTATGGIIMTSPMSGAGGFAKVGTGTLTLNVANPAMAGNVNVAAGTVRVRVDGALGTTAGATNVNGGTLEFLGITGPLTYATAEPINIAGNGQGGVGAISALFDTTITAPITVTASASIGSATPNNKLTISGPLNLALTSDLNFVGAGNIDVTSSFGNGATPISSFAALKAQYLHNSPNRTGSDLDGVGVAPGNQGLLAPGTVWEGEGLLKTAFNLTDAGATNGTVVGTFSNLFNAPGLNIDNFSVYFSGQLNVTAPLTIRFATGNIANLTGLNAPDSEGRVYLDLDQDHIYEDSNNEKVFTANGGAVGIPSAPITLAPGSYDILLPFTNGTGTGGINFSYSTDGGATYQLINPLAGTVGGVNFTNPTSFTLTPANNVNMNGTGVVTLFGNNTYNGTTTVNSGSLVAASTGAFGAGTTSINVNSGGTLGLSGNIAYGTAGTPFRPIKLNGVGSGQPGALVGFSGTPSYTGTITAADVSQGTFGIGALAGTTLTLNGTIDMRFSKVQFGGDGNVVVNSVLSGVGGSQFAAGIAEKIFDTSGGANGSTVNTGTSFQERRTRAVGPNDAQGVLTTQIHYTDAGLGGAGTPIATRVAALGGVGFNDDTWTAIWVTTFTPNEDGVWNFRSFAIDDNIAYFLDFNQDGVFDDTEVFGQRTCCGDTGTFSTPSLTSGQKYLLGIQLTDTGGGGGSRDTEFQSPTAAGVNGGAFTNLDPSLSLVPAGMFTTQFLSDNSVVKNGSGTLTLNATNTYTGTTTINAGVVTPLNPAALGTGSAGIVVNNGGTLGLAGNGTYGATGSPFKPITLNGTGAAGQSGALVALNGTPSYTGTISASNSAKGTFGIGAAAGSTLTLNGTIDMRFSRVVFDGAGSVIVNAPMSGVGPDQFTPGIQEKIFNASTGNPQTDIEEFRNRGLGAADGQGVLNGQINYNDDGSAGVDIRNRAPAIGAAGFDAGDWSGLWITTFTPNVSGVWGFRGFAIDDNVGFWVDSDQNGIFESTANRIGNRACCGDTGTYSTPALVAGQHYLFGIALTDTGGGGFIRDIEYQAPGGSFVNMDTTDPVTGNIFHLGTASDNSFVKNGTGTLTLNAPNPYFGNTSITNGTVNTGASNALGNNPASTLTVSGSATQVHLFNNASAVTTVGSAVFTATGTSVFDTGAGKLAVKSKTSLPSGGAFSGDHQLQGANILTDSAAAPRTATATTGTLDVSNVAPDTIAVADSGQLFFRNNVTGSRNNTFFYAAPTNSNVLVVSIATKSAVLNLAPTVTYDGTTMLSAIASQATATSAHNSFIFYLYAPNYTRGTLAPLVVNFSQDIQDGFSIYAQTLSGVDTTTAPLTARVSSTETNSPSVSFAVTGVTAGSAAISTFNYATGAGPLNLTSSSGAPQSGGTVLNGPAGTGAFWYSSLTNQIDAGGLFTNLGAGNVTFGANSATSAAVHFNGAVAVFKPGASIASTINLPNTGVVLNSGTTLTVNGPGNDVLGNVTINGNATIAKGANAPASVTFGGLSGAGAATLTINDNLGLKFTSGSTMNVDVNGTTAGQFDQVVVNGAVNLTGAALNVTTGFTPTVGNSVTLISNDGSDPVVGTFSGLAQGSVFSSGAFSYQISYTGGDGNDVVITAQAATPTTTSLVANPLATTGGSSVMFTATIAPTPGGVGTVTFLDNGTAIPGGSNIAVVGNQAVFSTTTLSSGNHPVTAVYSGGTGFAGSTSNVQNVTITGGGGGNPPTVVGITANGSSGPAAFANQSSRVVSVTVVFDQAVQLDANAMAIALHTNSVTVNGVAQPTGFGAVPTSLILNTTDNKTWTVTFAADANTDVGVGGIGGGGDTLASLKDGVYDFNIDASKVHPMGTPGVNMASNATGVFHRLFGDLDVPVPAGDGSVSSVVNTGDNSAFRTSFNNPLAYQPYFDFDGTGVINTGDNAAFRDRFNKALSWKV
jgi:fibronectin-binding autotransporter adhesin